MNRNYLRYPHLNGDLVAFVASDDVWLGPVEGGRAWRLTRDRAPVRSPRFSADGQHVAFVSFRDGHPEVMVTGVDGGAPRRLTWWGAKNTLLLGWDDQGRVLAATHAGEANYRHLVVKAVDLDGNVERLRYGPAGGLAVRADGTTVLCTPGNRPPAHWKRYRGGTAPRLWMDRTGEGDWEQLLRDETASLVDPLWVGDQLLFVSDRSASLAGAPDEQANLWVWADPGEGEPSQLTHQGPDEGYVRDATSDGQRVIWHSRGDLWLLEDLASTPRRLELALPGSAPVPVPATPTNTPVDSAAAPGGDASLVGWRGTAYWLSHRQGPARAVAAEPGVRFREPTLLGRTGSAALVSDAAGEDQLEIRSLTSAAEPRILAAGRLGRVLHLASDPAGERLATISHDGRVRVIQVADGSVRELHHSVYGEALDPRFSPDGRYLLWAEPTGGEGAPHRLVITDLTGDGEPVALTDGRFHDHSPTFSRDGAFVVFLSDRTFDPVYDKQEFALSFVGSTRPWLLPLSATEPAPFGPSADGWRISKPEDEGSKDATKAAPASPDLDAEGAEERVVPFPVPSGDYRQLRAAKDGVLWIREAGDTGVLGSRRAGVEGDPTPDTLEFWSLPQRRVITIADKVDSYDVSGDGERVVVRAKDTVTVLPAGRKVEEEEDPEKVTVDLTRLRHQVDPVAEWRQMFDENARIMRDHFWREDMDGVDWERMTQRWRPLVERLGSHDDLVDLVWETVGELNTSHAYVMPADPLGDQSRRLGLLGADLVPDEGGWRIERILPGESSEPDARSPLRAAGVDARPGDLVVAVDGSPVHPSYGPGASLIGAATKPVELTLRRDGAERRVVVVPLEDEEIIRYQDWVRSRREYVREWTGGRLGYLHVPDMMSYGWAQLHRDLRHAVKAEALIADVRYNRGGHTSQLVVARLAARVVGWGVGRHYADPSTYPDQAPRGPVVLVANESSGSDGDIVNAAAQAMGVGPVVGVRTWGGVVGIDGRFDLVDGTTITQPRYATWLEGKGWGVENHGVDPDIEVVHTPADFFSEDDPQLDRAIEEAFALLESRPTATVPPMPEPRVR